MRRRHERQQRSKLVSEFRVQGKGEAAGNTSDVVAAMRQFWERIGTTQTFIPSSCLGEESASEVFGSVQRHFQCRKEEVTVVANAKLVLGPTNGRLQKFAPIDCLAISRTHQLITAIFIVEDDLATEPEAALKRVNATQALLEEFFGGEFREGWSYVGLVFANRSSAHGICEECRDFVILGAEEMWEKLRRVLERVKRERPRFSASPTVYHTIASSLAFLASSSIQKVENGVASWICWSPSQLALLQSGPRLTRIVVYGDQSVGKSETLVARALLEAKEGKKKVMFVICSTEENKNYTERLTKAGITVKILNQKASSAVSITKQVIQLLKEQPHCCLFLDSLPIPTSEYDPLIKEVASLEQMVDGLLWVTISPEVNLDPAASLVEQGSTCSFLQDSFMQSEEEEGEKPKVVVPEVILKVFPAPWLLQKLDGPSFLLAP